MSTIKNTIITNITMNVPSDAEAILGGTVAIPCVLPRIKVRSQKKIDAALKKHLADVPLPFLGVDE